MPVELTAAAQVDVTRAALDYELERPGLGFRFEAELDRSLERIDEKLDLIDENERAELDRRLDRVDREGPVGTPWATFARKCHAPASDSSRRQRRGAS